MVFEDDYREEVKLWLLNLGIELEYWKERYVLYRGWFLRLRVCLICEVVRF